MLEVAVGRVVGSLASFSWGHLPVEGFLPIPSSPPKAQNGKTKAKTQYTKDQTKMAAVNHTAVFHSSLISPPSKSNSHPNRNSVTLFSPAATRGWGMRWSPRAGVNNSSSGGGGGGDVVGNKRVPNSNYVVPMDDRSFSSAITRPLAEILRDLNKRIPDNIINPSASSCFISWYHANRMLSFYAPGWCGEIRDVIFSENGSVTVVYRVTIRGSDGEAHRESTGTVSSTDANIADPVTAAEEIAFCRACARFGLGLYLYHEE